MAKFKNWADIFRSSKSPLDFKAVLRMRFDSIYFEREYLNKQKINNQMETENKNEKTYWVIFVSNALGDIYLTEDGRYSFDIMSAKRYGDIFSAKINCRDSECTLKITESIYKEGNILATKAGNVFIFDRCEGDKVYDKVFLQSGVDCLVFRSGAFTEFSNISGFAHETQKQLLFNALKKEGKRWNAEKKVIEGVIKPSSMSFTVKLSQESVDRLMVETDKILKYLFDSKNKSEELFKKIQDSANPKLSEMDQFKKDLEEDYEIQNVTQTSPVFEDTGIYNIVPRAIIPSKLIVTYKPKSK